VLTDLSLRANDNLFLRKLFSILHDVLTFRICLFFSR